jgi:hypothetical protein
MRKSPKGTSAESHAPHPVKDEPGAEERFKGILRRALNTPPPRKQAAAKPPRKAGK